MEPGVESGWRQGWGQGGGRGGARGAVRGGARGWGQGLGQGSGPGRWASQGECRGARLGRVSESGADPEVGAREVGEEAGGVKGLWGRAQVGEE